MALYHSSEPFCTSVCIYQGEMLFSTIFIMASQATTIICIHLVDLESLMLRFSLKAFLVLEEKIFKCFYHILLWQPSCSMVRNH